MKRFGLLALLLFGVGAKGQFNCQSTKHAPASYQMTAPIDYNSRSDTADLMVLNLYLNTTDFANKQLSGVAQYQIGAEINFTSLRFDLLGFTVDSVVSPTGPLSFTQSAEHVTVHQSANRRWDEGAPHNGRAENSGTLRFALTQIFDGQGENGWKHDAVAKAHAQQQQQGQNT